MIQIKNDYYINRKKLKSEKFLIIFPKIWTGKMEDGPPNS